MCTLWCLVHVLGVSCSSNIRVSAASLQRPAAAQDT